MAIILSYFVLYMSIIIIVVSTSLNERGSNEIDLTALKKTLTFDL